MPSQPSQARVHLGEMLVRRRIELDPRYRNRRTFVTERAPGLYRIINDIELGRWGKRATFEPGTFGALEDAYALEAGAIKRALDGGELEPVEPVPFPRAVPDITPSPPDESGEAAIYEPVIRQRLRDLAEAGDPRPSGEAVFLDGGILPGMDKGMAEDLAKGWNKAMTNRFVDADRAAGYLARTWALLLDYRRRRAERNSGQSGALART